MKTVLTPQFSVFRKIQTLFFCAMVIQFLNFIMFYCGYVYFLRLCSHHLAADKTSQLRLALWIWWWWCDGYIFLLDVSLWDDHHINLYKWIKIYTGIDFDVRLICIFNSSFFSVVFFCWSWISNKAINLCGIYCSIRECLNFYFGLFCSFAVTWEFDKKTEKQYFWNIKKIYEREHCCLVVAARFWAKRSVSMSLLINSLNIFIF